MQGKVSEPFFRLFTNWWSRVVLEQEIVMENPYFRLSYRRCCIRTGQLGAKYASFGALSITSWLIGDYNDNVFFLDRRNLVFSGKTNAFGWRKHSF